MIIRGTRRRAALLLSVALLSSLEAFAQTVGGKKEERKPLAWMGIHWIWRRVDASRVLQVVKVVRRGPAEVAGIEAGDFITHIDGDPVGAGDELDFLLAMGARKPGERLQLRVIRDGSHRHALLVLAAMDARARATWERRVARAQRQRSATSPR